MRGQILISVSGNDHRGYRTEGNDAACRSVLPSVPSLISAPWSDRLKTVDTLPEPTTLIPRCRDGPLPYQVANLSGIPYGQNGRQNQARSSLEHSSLDRRLASNRRHSAGIPNRPSFLPPMPAGFETRTTTQGQIYYVNQRTGVVSSLFISPSVVMALTFQNLFYRCQYLA